ncbi:hypothetical protein A6410_05120 [Prescottella equi]|nr:hypothetical protein A6410_05120 [Prescottella equi]
MIEFVSIDEAASLMCRYAWACALVDRLLTHETSLKCCREVETKNRSHLATEFCRLVSAIQYFG